MSERTYFEQFSGHLPTDDTWWDTWSVVYSGFIHKECRSEKEAESELLRLQRHFPNHSFRIVHTEQAGFGDMRFKALDYPIFPITDRELS